MTKQTRYTHQFRAMGCQVSFWLDTSDPADARYALHTAEYLFHRVESQLSRFQLESELSLFNRQAGTWVTASHLFFDIVQAATQAAAITGGLFDPTVHQAVVAAGYRHPFTKQTPSPAAQADVDPTAVDSSWAQIELDPARQAVRVPAGVGLDLGGIAKGYTAVLASRVLARIGPNLVNAGGDITAGDAPQGEPGWPVSIANPFHAGQDLATLWLSNATLTTSGRDYRRWAGGHHIIDPRTNRPAQNKVLMASVWHPSAIVAETWATAVMVAGKQEGLEMLAAYGLAGLLVDDQEQVTLSPEMEPRVYFKPQEPRRMNYEQTSWTTAVVG